MTKGGRSPAHCWREPRPTRGRWPGGSRRSGTLATMTSGPQPDTRGVTRATLSAGGCERADAIEFVAQPVFFHFQVIAGLQVDPEPLGGAEESCQPQRGVRTDCLPAERKVSILAGAP